MKAFNQGTISMDVIQREWDAHLKHACAFQFSGTVVGYDCPSPRKRGHVWYVLTSDARSLVRSVVGPSCCHSFLNHCGGYTFPLLD